MIEINNLKLFLLEKILMEETVVLKESGFQSSLDGSNIEKRYKNYIQSFLTKTESSFTFKNIDKKLETLTIKELSTPLGRRLSFGSYYDIIKNEIKLLTEEDIYHELFHTFTSYKKIIINLDTVFISVMVVLIKQNL